MFKGAFHSRVLASGTVGLWRHNRQGAEPVLRHSCVSSVVGHWPAVNTKHPGPPEEAGRLICAVTDVTTKSTNCPISAWQMSTLRKMCRLWIKSWLLKPTWGWATQIFFFFFFCKRKLLCKPGQNYSIKNGHRKAVQQQFQELVCENLHFLCVKSSHFFCHSELLISGIRSVILQFGNHLNIWQRNHVACGVSRKLLHWIEIMNVFFLKNVTELIHHNFKERWLLWRTGDKVCHSWTSTCQTASKKKKKKRSTLSRQS